MVPSGARRIRDGVTIAPMLTKKDEDAAKKYLRETPIRDLAFGQVTEGRLFPGKYRFMPILGWLADPPKIKNDARTQAMDRRWGGPTRKLILSGALLKMTEGSFVGSLDWSIPVTEVMEPVIFDLLATFGWDLRIWPYDAGWPDDSPEEARGLETLLVKKDRIATLTFPPGPNGNRVMTVHVLKTGRVFPLPPVVSKTDLVSPTTELREKFRKLEAADFTH